MLAVNKALAMCPTSRQRLSNSSKRMKFCSAAYDVDLFPMWSSSQLVIHVVPSLVKPEQADGHRKYLEFMWWYFLAFLLRPSALIIFGGVL